MGQEAFETIIGLEVHVQLSTESKAFCRDKTEFGASPNSQIGAISLGHPGTLPFMNKKQVQYATRLGLALNGAINEMNTFDSKNYFYADLPKGYQITQDKKPISVGGYLPIKMGDVWKNIRIHHIHIEEDAGKSIHTLHDSKSFIDLNRAGIPLIEIVTEPDLRSGAEVDAFMSGIRQLVRYLEISDGNMEEGSLRCDVNISPLRSKEDAHDYRYFPEPDLPPIQLSADFLDTERKNISVLPWEAFHFLHNELGLPVQEASILSELKDTFIFYKGLLEKVEDKKLLTNFMVNKLLPSLHEKGLSLAESPLSKEGILQFLSLISSGKLSHSIAYQKLFPLWMENPSLHPLDLAESQQWLQEKEEGKIELIFKEIIAEYPQKWSEFTSGKKGLAGFFMGELMKKTSGKSNPKEAMDILISLQLKK